MELELALRVYINLEEENEGLAHLGVSPNHTQIRKDETGKLKKTCPFR